MSNYFILELDTTGPEIEIIAPEYASSSDLIEITIQANEMLDTFNDIEIVSCLGTANTVFTHYGDHFVGNFRFTGCMGAVTIKASVRDEAHNTSFAEKTIQIIDASHLMIDWTEHMQGICVADAPHAHIDVSEQSALVEAETMSYSVETLEIADRIFVQGG